MSDIEPIIIRGYGSISPLGHDRASVFNSYQQGRTSFQIRDFNGVATQVGALAPEGEAALAQLAQEKKAYQTVDRCVLMAIHAGRQALAEAGWSDHSGLVINMGSSRGATGLFEQHLQEFQTTGAVSSHTSPVTTLGNISSWVAQDIGATGPTISHSVTCSTGIQALANGFAWLKSGMARTFLAGASEAPLTPFTIAQMKAIGIYATDVQTPYPCRPHNAEKRNTFVLGEGAAVFALEKITKEALQRDTTKPIVIESIGFGFEAITSKTGISKEGDHFQLAIRNALEKANSSAPIDLVIMHAPGTVSGDSAEWRALENVFGAESIPAIASAKWLTGHTLGASACLSLEYALYILRHQDVMPFPYSTHIPLGHPKPIKRILLTAAGFGGNASAIIVSQAG